MMQLGFAKVKCLMLVLALLTTLSSLAQAELKVVTTTPDLASVAQAVGGQYVSVKALALPTQDPHFVDARPNLALDLAKADLLVLVGSELEVGWLPTLLTASRNGAIQSGAKGYLDASTLVSLLEVPKSRVDRSMGDVHMGGNPHYMYDPRRAAKVAEGIAKRMGELDSTHKSAYLENAKSFSQKLGKWRQHWEKELAHLKGKRVIAYHKSMTYMADWLGFQVTAELEPKPGIPPNPGHVAHVIQVGKSAGVKLLLQESFYPSKTSQLVAQKIGAKLAVIPGGPAFRGNESYIGFVHKYVERLKASTVP